MQTHLSCPTPGPMLFFGSGRKVDAFHFEADDLPPPLIGRGLSKINRFSGNGDRTVSVAQHSRNLSFMVGDCPHRQRAALMHDLPELFTGDVPTPIKLQCPAILAIDACMIARVAVVYGIPEWAFEAIKSYDSRISFDERLMMFDHLEPADREAALAGQLGFPMIPVTPEVAATSWTRRFYQLFKESLN